MYLFICCSADLYENDAIQSLLDFRPWWEEVYKKSKSGAEPEDIGMVIQLEFMMTSGLG